jgi:hypothetical protein
MFIPLVTLLDADKKVLELEFLIFLIGFEPMTSTDASKPYFWGDSFCLFSTIVGSGFAVFA